MGTCIKIDVAEGFSDAGRIHLALGAPDEDLLARVLKVAPGRVGLLALRRVGLRAQKPLSALTENSPVLHNKLHLTSSKFSSTKCNSDAAQQILLVLTADELRRHFVAR